MASAERPPAIFVMGPTASGKTDLAIALQEHLPVELINVDSAQIYRQLDIGSAKPDKTTLAAAPHRLIDILDPLETYSAADFIADATREMAEITSRGKIPLLVGGTMLYFKALLEGLSDMPSADADIRAEILEHLLHGEVREIGVGALPARILRLGEPLLHLGLERLHRHAGERRGEDLDQVVHRQLRDRLARLRGLLLRAARREQLGDVLVEELQVRVHEADRVVQLMGDARRQLADGGHLFRLQQLVVGFFQALVQLALGGQRGVQALALGVKSLQHGQALGQAFDVICFSDGHLGLAREISGLKPPTYKNHHPDRCA